MKAKQSIVLAFVVGVAIALPVGCGSSTGSGTCNTTNCTGCCSSKGTCVGGTANGECGKGGMTCSSCTGAMPVCNAGVCKATGGGAGGGAAGGGAGGGAAGGGAGGGAAGGGAGGGAAGGGAGGGAAGGGAGGGAAGGGAGGGAAGGGAGGGAAGGGAGGGAATACGASAAADHLLITEVRVTPTPAEAIEIYNPTNAAVDLTNYRIYNATFLGDGGNDCRYYLHDGGNCGKDNFDFDIQFPSGAMINAGQTIVIAVAGAPLYCGDAGLCGTSLPNFEIAPPTGGNAGVPDMIGNWDPAATLSNGAEDVILYKWDGTSANVQDVDYFVWANNQNAANALLSSKTGVGTYLADTAISAQRFNDGGTTAQTSYQRSCYNEGSETKTGGNGITNHDETSENMGGNWITAPHSLGVKNPGSVP